MKVSEVTGKCFSEVTSKCLGIILCDGNKAIEKRVDVNTVIIPKGEKIPISVTERFCTVHDGQTGFHFKVTEGTAAEKDPKFVNIIWDGTLELPPGRPAGQPIDVTCSYNDNQIMQCSVLDVTSGKKTEISLEMASIAKEDIDKFIVE